MICHSPGAASIARIESLSNDCLELTATYSDICSRNGERQSFDTLICRGTLSRQDSLAVGLINSQKQMLKFGAFEVDLTCGELRKNGVKLRLQGQPFQVLAALLEYPGQVVSREELRKKLWPADTFVDFDKGLNTAINKIRETLGDSAERPRFVETIPRRGYRFLDTVGTTGSDSIDSIAVLPFLNTSSGPDAEYLALGIPGSIIHNLSRFPGLRVIAWSTVSAYKDRESVLRTGGSELHARAVLLGRIWQRKDRLRVQVDLVNSATGEELWGEQYDRDITEVFSVQDEISREVSLKLQLKLGADPVPSLPRRHTANIEAYQLYLRGRRHSEKRSTEGFQKGVEYLTEAIRKDPGYALAYAELAQCVYMPAYYGRVSPHEVYPKAKELALKALQMDDSLAQAHDALATVRQNYNYDWAGAEEEYKRAVALDPNYTTGRFHYSMHLDFLARFEEAIFQAREGQIRDPLSGITNVSVAFALLCARQFDACRHQSLTTVDLDPSMTFTYVSLGVAYEGMGMFAEGVAAHERSLALGGSPALHIPMIGHIYAAAGDLARARQVLESLQNLSREKYIPHWSFAIVHEGLGNIESAIDSLEKGFQNRETLLTTVKVWPHFDKLRDKPRFQEIERRVGLGGSAH